MEWDIVSIHHPPRGTTLESQKSDPCLRNCCHAGMPGRAGNDGPPDDLTAGPRRSIMKMSFNITSVAL